MFPKRPGRNYHSQPNARKPLPRHGSKDPRLERSRYRVIEKWECDVQKTHDALPNQETRTYPDAILYDFELRHDKSQRNEVAAALTYEATHVPITVSIGDTLERETTHICERNPKELIQKFTKELERHWANIRRRVRAEFMPEDSHLLTGKGRRVIAEWCDQVPVVGFNSGHCDMNQLKESFVELVADTTAKVQVGKKAHTTMFMKTSGFRFVDLINYLGPGTSYEKWFKAYCGADLKSHMPYELFDTPGKLDFLGCRITRHDIRA